MVPIKATEQRIPTDNRVFLLFELDYLVIIVGVAEL